MKYNSDAMKNPRKYQNEEKKGIHKRKLDVKIMKHNLDVKNTLPKIKMK